MSSKLETLNDKINPDKKEEKKDKNEKEDKSKKEEEKKEVPKEDEPKKEEPKKEEPKKEEKKEEPKTEANGEDKKEEEKKEGPKPEEEKEKKKKKAKKRPREPDPKNPTDFTKLITELKEIKEAGNALFKSKSYEEAILKYKEGNEKIEKEFSQINLEKSFNPQSEELLTLSKQMMSNLALCYGKTEQYEKGIEIDLKIISLDPNYDKSYARLFNNYMKLGKKEQADYFGSNLLKFDDETKKKYENDITEIEKNKKILKEEYDAIRAKQRKEMLKSIAKYGIPIIVLIAAFAIYFFVFKKKQIAK